MITVASTLKYFLKRAAREVLFTDMNRLMTEYTVHCVLVILLCISYCQSAQSEEDWLSVGCCGQ